MGTIGLSCMRQARTVRAARHLVVLTSRQDRLELGTHPSKDEQESYGDMIGLLTYRSRYSVISDVTSMVE
jgi:hypothetical protein